MFTARCIHFLVCHETVLAYDVGIICTDATNVQFEAATAIYEKNIR